MNDENNECVTKEWCRLLPKCELHAHLNGSFRQSTIQEFAARRGLPIPFLQHSQELTREELYKNAFSTFELIHKVVTGLDEISRLAKEMVEDAINDGVIYTEIRTTPKAYNEPSSTRRDYIDTVCRTITQHCNAATSFIRSGVIVSINRSNSIEEAEEALNIAYEYTAKEKATVVGLEFSGNPYNGEFAHFAPIFLKARSLGLNTTLHFAESNMKVNEMDEMINTDPMRIGHCLYPTKPIIDRLLTLRLPIECCLTSGLSTNSLTALHTHPAFTLFRQPDHTYPICVCTDDYGVFNTTLTNEYHLAALHYGLKKCELVELAKNSLTHSFLPAWMRTEVENEFAKRVSVLQ